MGHDHHFLSRLDRVARDQVDFSLALYRDHDRTAWILERARLPGEAARVALAIDRGPRTPHVIVTREGHFVTCLASGMSTGSSPVVTREVLDRLSREYETHLERHRLRGRLEDERRAHGTRGTLFDRIFYGGPALTREEFVALSAFAPMMTDMYWQVLTTELRALGDILVATIPVFARARKAQGLSRAWVPTLQRAGRSFWGIQHAVLLYGMHARELLEKIPDSVEYVTHTLLRVPIFGGLGSTLLRTSWALANIGSMALSLCRKWWETADTSIEIVSGATALASFGLRYPGLERDVKRWLATRRPEGPSADFARWVGEVTLLAFDPTIVDDVRKGRPFEKVVDESLGRWATASWNLLEKTDDLPHVVVALAFAARAEAEQFYLPRERAGEITATLSHAGWLLAKQHEASRKSLHAKLPKGQPRNAPCPCGSGKKYKRCCGETS